MAEIKLKCFSCQTELSFTVMISRRDECPQCRNDVRVCKNCQFYDPKAYNECRESSAEYVQEKERATMCDYFQPGGQALTQNSKDAMLAAAEALFKKK